jgi:hypothetical protein
MPKATLKAECFFIGIGKVKIAEYLTKKTEGGVEKIEK